MIDTINLNLSNDSNGQLGFVGTEKNPEKLIKNFFEKNNIKYKKIGKGYLSNWFYGKYNNTPVQARYNVSIKPDSIQKIILRLEIRRIKEIDINSNYFDILKDLKSNK